MPDKPNIIYILSDQHRSDAMGCAGNKVIQTPSLDQLAANGVRFTRAHCQSPVCQPARASIITGLYTQQHGISRNDKEFDPAWPTMMKQLQKAGYTTALFGKTHFHHPRSQATADGIWDMRQKEDFVRSFGYDYVMEEFDRYVHAFDQVRTHYTEYLKGKGVYEPYRDQIRSIFRLTPHHWDGVTSVLSHEDELSSFIADRAVDWLKSAQCQQPFFLSLNFVAPHVPLMDAPIWADYYKDAQIELGPNVPPEIPNQVWGEYMKSLQQHSNSHLLTDEYVLNGARHYYGSISLFDQKIGEVLSLLDALDLAGNTWIVYSADHGEMLGDHNLMAKMSFYKPCVVVPAIIKPPAPMAGRVENGIVEAIDLTATILDIAGAEPMPGSDAISLLSCLGGQGKTRDAAFSAISGMGGRYYFFSVHTGRFRYTMERNTGTPCELFDLVEDPLEMRNLVNDPGYARVVKEMAELLLPSL